MLAHFVAATERKSTLSSVIVIYVCVISDCVLTRAQWWFYNTERGKIFFGGLFVWSLLVEPKISEIWSRTIVTQKLWGRIFFRDVFLANNIDENRFRSHATMYGLKDFSDLKDALKFDNRTLKEVRPKSEMCPVKFLMQRIFFFNNLIESSILFTSNF